MILVTCPDCEKKLRVQDSHAGKLAQCPACKGRLRIPDGPDADTPDRPKKTRPAASDAIRAESRTTGKPSVRRRVPEHEERDEVDDVERDEQEEPRRPKKRRKKRKKVEYSPMPIVFVWVGVAVGIYGLLVLWATFARGGRLSLLIGGGILFVCARIWFIWIARQEDVLAYIMVRFVPFYSIYYFFTRIRETYRPFILGTVGATFALTGLVAMLLRGDFKSHLERELDNFAPQVQGIAPPGPAGLVKGPVEVPAGNHKVLLKKDDRLTATDPGDKTLDESRCKTYSLPLKAGKTYLIDMVSNELDAFLRVNDPEGKTVADDDDSGGDLNARILFSPQRDGTYQIVATSVDPVLGSYTLTVQELEQANVGQE